MFYQYFKCSQEIFKVVKMSKFHLKYKKKYFFKNKLTVNKQHGQNIFSLLVFPLKLGFDDSIPLFFREDFETLFAATK